MRSLSFITLIATAYCSQKSYEGFQVLRTGTLDHTSVKLLRQVQDETNLDFWKDPAPGRSADIMVSAEVIDDVKIWLTKQGISYHTMVDNVERRETLILYFIIESFCSDLSKRQNHPLNP